LPEAASNSTPVARPRRWTILGAALLLLALALVVIYTSRAAFFSPLALVVVAAIGLAALLMQLRLRKDIERPIRTPLWLTILGLICAAAAIFSDRLHLAPRMFQTVALAAVTCFGISGIVVLHTLRKPR
jgi:drug/metabolite transporter (DMT)-like permease